MGNIVRVSQNPFPGTHILMFRGDAQTFTLTLSTPLKGNAWLRTNLGHAKTTRTEIIREVFYNEPPLGRDWFDLPMRKIDDLTFVITVPLSEVGHFEAKCFFLKEDDIDPIWPDGQNTVINVEPAATCCANIIYNAFIRQFGPNKEGRGFANQTEENWIQNLDTKGYTVIPPSGKFRDLIRELDFIIGKLGCRAIQLLPINPTPTTYARMGRFGSPYAALSFTAVDSALAEFDTKATPLEQFIELVDAVHARSAKILIDIAINHTGWAASLHETNPEWLVRSEDGHIQVPGAWGMRWEDLTKLDYSKKDMWDYMANIFLTWCRRGVDGFRCDAGYMIPLSAWRFIVSIVREQFPDTIFFLEGLGGKISATRDILNSGNFNMAYSELFQNYDRGQLEHYLPGANAISSEDGILLHFAETHDNNRLASSSKTYAKMRTALCALLSCEGSFGFANGVEWFATEKINVHGASSLNWGAEDNQVDHIKTLSNILKTHPAFFNKTQLSLIQHGEGNFISLLRNNILSGKKLLIVANLDDNNQTHAFWNAKKSGMKETTYIDLITSRKIHVDSSGNYNSYLLNPGMVLCLTNDENDLELINIKSDKDFIVPDKVAKQKMNAKALEILLLYKGNKDIGEFDIENASKSLADNPVEFCRSFNSFSAETRVKVWNWPNDAKREVMVPPSHFLMAVADKPFQAQITDGNYVLSNEESLPRSDGGFFALFSPLQKPIKHRQLTLKLTVYEYGLAKHTKAPLLYLSEPEDTRIKRTFTRSQLLKNHTVMLDTNRRGAMLHVPVFWGTLNSKYDAILAANTNSEYPVDRLVVFSRCRAWVVYQGFSQDICSDCFDLFEFDYKEGGLWRYRIPTSQGEHIHLNIKLQMVNDKNSVRITFTRLHSNKQDRTLSDDKAIRLILRPDIEYRSFHETTKAFKGPENFWPNAVSAKSSGFVFAPERENALSVNISKGDFVSEPQWQYMIHRQIESQRGLDPDSDLFSPGYFHTLLNGGEECVLSADVGNITKHKPVIPNPLEKTGSLSEKRITSIKIEDALKLALDNYIVSRGSYKSIIAGYPWFLDWGRDSLIFTRGMIAAGKYKDSELVIKQFARFEKDGTIPNMISGHDAANRDTSDAPLWLFVACSDLSVAKGEDSFLNQKLDDRDIGSILISTANRLISGTPNGIYMDNDSGLLFSPAHFTWMDTNYPACTPREGYPIEIQALWYKALLFLSQIDSGSSDKWSTLAAIVQKSIYELFPLEGGYLSDCLYASSGIPARKAEKDDALRPNQLLAITLGAVSDFSLCEKILSACDELLVPGAIRSLADRRVNRPLEIKHYGTDLNDPLNPYKGSYEGDEDTKRKLAYHNGTAWTWLFPSFCEAWAMTYGDKAKYSALSLLSSSTQIIMYGCTGHVPEIIDGDYPHKARGCDAQAWGASELLRVWLKLSK
ncbi:MAG: glycogen debranching enzyme N-terminal domain-containing protein [Proteobacteria bacterium]|nr:glycogen debranching enzyme N-terminal domain-containing protein [Pseudomonadota bacterium]